MAKLLHLAVFTLSFAALGIPAQASEKHTLTYDVYAGGIHVLEAAIDVDTREKGRYSLIMNAQTRGFLASLAPWSGSFETHGWRVSADDWRPELHKSVSVWREEEEIKEYNYSKDGGFQNLYVKDFKKKRKKRTVEMDITKDTTDVLTAAFMVFENVRDVGECSGESLVFDGKRRFKMTFKNEDAEMLKPVKYNVFEGVAAKCTVEVEPAGGRWHNKPRGWMSIQEQGRDKGTMPTLWLAKVIEGAPAIPVKMQIKTNYGTLFMHMTKHEYTSGPQDIATASEKDK